ncbi:protein of unknown function [Burkholderia multivorans]
MPSHMVRQAARLSSGGPPDRSDPAGACRRGGLSVQSRAAFGRAFGIITARPEPMPVRATPAWRSNPRSTRPNCKSPTWIGITTPIMR